MQPLVIVGTGLAGYTLAREFRRLDTARPLLMISADDGCFYSKPMLSSALSQGKTARELATASAARMEEQLGARILTHTRVEGLDPGKKELRTESGRVAYSSLVLAVGASPMRPPLSGSAVQETLYVNNLGDYTHFRERIAGAARVAIIGPGLIGCEFANDLTSNGIRVAVIGPDPTPISTLLPPPVGRDLQAALAAKLGVSWHLNTTASIVERTASGLQLGLSDGTRVATDAVLVAVGLRPNIQLARRAGLAVRRGIVADRYLRTSREDVFALGDCAEIAGLNLPFVMPAMHGARALAKTLAGTPTVLHYPPMPVVIKTLSHPVVVSPPPRGSPGDWEVSVLEDGVEALFKSPTGELRGFALSGGALVRKQALTRKLPPML